MALRAQTGMGSSRPDNAGARRRPRDSPRVTLPSTWLAAPSPTCVHPRDKPGMKLTARQRPVHGCPLRRLRAPAPHAARRNITPAPVKPQGVPVHRPPTEDEPRKPPWEPSIPLIQGRNPPPPHERPACGCPLRRLRAPAPHAARHNITPAPVKPQGVPVRRPPTPKPSPKAPIRQPPPPKPNPRRPSVKRPDTQTGRPLQGYPPAPA